MTWQAIIAVYALVALLPWLIFELRWAWPRRCESRWPGPGGQRCQLRDRHLFDHHWRRRWWQRTSRQPVLECRWRRSGAQPIRDCWWLP